MDDLKILMISRYMKFVYIKLCATLTTLYSVAGGTSSILAHECLHALEISILMNCDKINNLIN